MPRSPVSPDAARKAGSVIFRFILLLAVLSPAMLFGTASFVLYQAERVANGRPFCVQYATQKGVSRYTPVRSLWQLTFVAMHVRYLGLGGRMSDQFSLPGVLVVDQAERADLWRWSWSGLNWKVLSNGQRQGLRVEAVCNPHVNFGDELPIVWNTDYSAALRS